ncbi:amino acid adenylation domain-containing protein [Streptomyces sp. LZ34]
MLDGGTPPADTSWIPVGNGRGHFSVWAAERTPPDGWRPVGAPSDRATALDSAARAWQAADAGAAVAPDPAPPDTVERSFARQARADPTRVAVVEGTAVHTYGELATRAARIRAGLAREGIGPGGVVGVCVDRGADLLALLLGVLACGAAYVPLDGGYPAPRLGFMVRDSGAERVVCAPHYAEALSGVEVPVVGVAELCERVAPDPSPGLSEPDGLAYIMFTSGSTGQPKSVEVTHRNLAHFLDAMVRTLPPGAAERTLLSTQLCFDIAGLEIFLPLVTGGTCVVAPYTWLPRARSLAALVNTAAPTLVQATPARWRMLLDSGARFGPGQTLLCGGDALPPSLAERLSELPARSFNLYGPTEASVWATAWAIDGPRVSIGDALPHARVHVLDDTLTPVRDGAEGEAYIAGPAVVRGYRGQPRLTAERFVPDPWSPAPGGRMYATGDIVRVVGGRLEWLRRGDTQVKVNGHRVELGEIECVAESVTGVRAAAAVITGDAETAALSLFVESAEPTTDTDTDTVCKAVRERLAHLLPPAMVPRWIQVLDTLPLTHNGKVDRKSLTTTARPSRP